MTTFDVQAWSEMITSIRLIGKSICLWSASHSARDEYQVTIGFDLGMQKGNRKFHNQPDLLCQGMQDVCVTLEIRK